MNILITGEVNVGKSTLVRNLFHKMKINENRISGFSTQNCIKDAMTKKYIIKQINVKINVPDLEDRIIGIVPIKERKLQSITNNFNNYGVRILNECLKNNSNVILIDEIGVFEKDAVNFQKKLNEILDSKKDVFMILKKATVPFVESIKNRNDVFLYELSIKNRNILLEDIYDFVKNKS